MYISTRSSQVLIVWQHTAGTLLGDLIFNNESMGKNTSTSICIERNVMTQGGNLNVE